MSLRYIDVLPSNISTTANAGYSQGSPLVQFVIGAQDAFLLGSTIRLNGHYEIDGSNSANAQWEPSLGIYNVLEQLIIASNKTNQTIEHIRNYNRFLSSYTKVTSSEADLLGHMNMTSLTTTTETQCLKFDGTAFDFSIPLPCGLFLGRNPIPLAAQWGTKGLNITLHLAPDSNVFFSTSGYTGNNSVYKLKNLHLTAEVQVPPPDQLSKLMNQTANSFEYNSISSYYAVINNSYATINLNLGLRRVLAELWPPGSPSTHWCAWLLARCADEDDGDNDGSVQGRNYFPTGPQGPQRNPRGPKEFANTPASPYTSTCVPLSISTSSNVPRVPPRARSLDLQAQA